MNLKRPRWTPSRAGTGYSGSVFGSLWQNENMSAPNRAIGAKYFDDGRRITDFVEPFVLERDRRDKTAIDGERLAVDLDAFKLRRLPFEQRLLRKHRVEAGIWVIGVIAMRRGDWRWRGRRRGRLAAIVRTSPG